mgnify:CR=1 FL=1
MKKLAARHGMNEEDMEFFLGHGHAKGRNTVMYYAIKHNMDYLLFWDDDEYPLANIKEEGDAEINWQKQPTIKQHKCQSP